MPDLLTKKEFWDKLYEQYPDGVEVFCKWIDEYKKRVGWNSLFNEGHKLFSRAGDGNGYDPTGGVTKAPKFHDMPDSMQLGVLLEFALQYDAVTGHEWDIDDLFGYDFVKSHTEFFKLLHEDDDCREQFIHTLKERGQYPL